MDKWYYVEGQDSKGPVNLNELKDKILAKELQQGDYVWKPGFANWCKISDVPELISIKPKDEQVAALVADEKHAQTPEHQIPHINMELVKRHENFSSLGEHDRVFFIKTGFDRAAEEQAQDYGPFSLHALVRLFAEQRINGLTYVWKSDFPAWIHLLELPFYQIVFDQQEVESSLETSDERRKEARKPFVARLFFHNKNQLFEGLCRDISIGGMQILAANIPCQVGESISMNVHPENSDYHFVAKGKVVRVISGEQGVCVRFQGLSEEAIDAIEKYIRTA